MPIQLPDSIRRELFKQESGEVVLTLLTLSHPSFGEPIRLVNNSSDVVSRGNVYVAFPFTITLPTDDGETFREASIVLDNTSLELIGHLRSVTEEIPAKLEIIMASLPDQVQMDFSELVLNSIQYNLKKISGSLVMDNFLNSEAASEKYTPSLYPGLY